MGKNDLERRVARRFDGEARGDALNEEALESAEAQAHLAQLQKIRNGIEQVAVRETINDAQFPSFMAGIRERIETPQRHARGLWALASLTAAALIVAVSVFLIFASSRAPGVSTVVEAAESGIAGTTVNTYSSSDGTATVWVTEAQRDIQ